MSHGWLGPGADMLVAAPTAPPAIRASSSADEGVRNGPGLPVTNQLVIGCAVTSKVFHMPFMKWPGAVGQLRIRVVDRHYVHLLHRLI
jgi:hypothetical protein